MNKYIRIIMHSLTIACLINMGTNISAKNAKLFVRTTAKNAAVRQPSLETMDRKSII